MICDGADKGPVMKERTQMHENTKQCVLTAWMDEWLHHDSNGNPILEYGCVQSRGIAQSLPKSIIYFLTISDFTGRKFYSVIRHILFPGVCFISYKIRHFSSFVSFYFIVHLRLSNLPVQCCPNGPVLLGFS